MEAGKRHSLPNDILPHELARLSVEIFIGDGAIIEPPAEPQGILASRAGAFVTLRKSNGQLRGCIGTIYPERSNVAREIVQNAISAATRDPRFPPVATSELFALCYSVDVLSTPKSFAPSFGMLASLKIWNRRFMG